MNNLHLLKENAMHEHHQQHSGVVANTSDPDYEGEDHSPDFVLYVWGNQESCSRNALATAQQTSAINVISVVDARDLKLQDIPVWLKGVPTLLSVDTMEVFKGTECLNELERIGENVDSYMPVLSVDTTASQQPSQSDFRMPRQTELPPQVSRDPKQQPTLETNMMEPQSEKKSDAEELKKEVEAIMKRREQLMQASGPVE